MVTKENGASGAQASGAGAEPAEEKLIDLEQEAEQEADGAEPAEEERGEPTRRQPEGEPRRQTRADKKRERGTLITQIAEMQKAREAAEARAERIEKQMQEEAAARRREIDELRTRVAPQQHADPLDAKIATLRQRMGKLQQALTGDPKSDQALIEQYAQLEEELTDARVEKRVAAHMAEKSNGDDGYQRAKVEVERAQLVAVYPWLDSNPKAQSEAQTEYRYLVERRGRPETLQTKMEACANVAADRGLPGAPRSQPSALDRGAYETAPARNGGGGTGGGEERYRVDPFTLREAKAQGLSAQDLIDSMKRQEAYEGEDRSRGRRA